LKRLDLSDTGNFFSAYVPVRALDEDCLRDAIEALSAKHLAKMKGVTAANISGMFTSPPTMETYPNAQQVDWSLKAANYYYLAVSHMNSSISNYASVSSTAALESPIAIANQWLSLQLSQMERTPDKTLNEAVFKKAENLLATSTILTLYKILDEPGENWQSYLTGIKPLFSQILRLISESDESSAHFFPGITAVFWNFARLDYQASYYNRLPTHLEPEDLVLWRAAGLSLDDQGNASSISSTHLFSREDTATNALTRLLNKLTNFLAASKRSQLEHWVGRPSESPTSFTANAPSPSLEPTTATWLKLSFEFQSWVERMPETFRPCLRLERPKSISDAAPMPFPEIFYSLTSCASAMQQYHFGRLALSLNRPVDEVSGPATAFDRLQGYRELTKEVDHRCREICGVALGRPRGAARVQMITLLYAVGQCLEKPEERQIVIDLLRGIEADLGWSTATQVQKLKR
jgi:proteasome lid subunit RPN8/RPN11